MGHGRRGRRGSHVSGTSAHVSRVNGRGGGIQHMGPPPLSSLTAQKGDFHSPKMRYQFQVKVTRSFHSAFALECILNLTEEMKSK